MTLTPPQARFYDELAEWWPPFSPPSHYDEEAADLLERLRPHVTIGAATLLELGSGGGSLASHLAPHFALTLTDRSAGMLDVSRSVNPGAAHVLADMRTLGLGRQFDVVLVHDAIMRHVEGLFSRGQWLAWLAAAGLDASSEIDPWGRDAFIAVRRS